MSNTEAFRTRGTEAISSNRSTRLDLGKLFRSLTGPEKTPETKEDPYVIKSKNLEGIADVRWQRSESVRGGTNAGEVVIEPLLLDFQMNQLEQLVNTVRQKLTDAGGAYAHSNWRRAGMEGPEFAIERSLYELTTTSDGHVDKEKIKKWLTNSRHARKFVEMMQAHIDQDISRQMQGIGRYAETQPNRKRDEVTDRHLHTEKDRSNLNRILVNALREAVEDITQRGDRKFRGDSRAAIYQAVQMIGSMSVVALFGPTLAAAITGSTVALAAGVTLSNLVGNGALMSVLTGAGATAIDIGVRGAIVGGILTARNAMREGIFFRKRGLSTGISDTLHGERYDGTAAGSGTARRSGEIDYLNDRMGIDQLGIGTPLNMLIRRSFDAALARGLYYQSVTGESAFRDIDAMLETRILQIQPGERMELEEASTEEAIQIYKLFIAEYQAISGPPPRGRPGLDVDALIHFPPHDQDRHRAAMLEAMRLARAKYILNSTRELHHADFATQTAYELTQKAAITDKLTGLEEPPTTAEDGIDVTPLVGPDGRAKSGSDESVKQYRMFLDQASRAGSPNPIEALARYQRQKDKVFGKKDSPIIAYLRAVDTTTNRPAEMLTIESRLFPGRILNGSDVSREVTLFLDTIIDGNIANLTTVPVHTTTGNITGINIEGLNIDGPFSTLRANREAAIRTEITSISTTATDSISRLEDLIRPHEQSKVDYETFRDQISTTINSLTQTAHAAGQVLSSMAPTHLHYATKEREYLIAQAELTHWNRVRNDFANPAIVRGNTVSSPASPPAPAYNTTIACGRAEYDLAMTALNTNKPLLERRRQDLQAAQVRLTEATSRSKADTLTDPVMIQIRNAEKTLTLLRDNYRAELAKPRPGVSTEAATRASEFTAKCLHAYHDFTAIRQPPLTQTELATMTVDALMARGTANGYWAANQQDLDTYREQMQLARIHAIAVNAGGPTFTPAQMRDAVNLCEGELRTAISLQQGRLNDIITDPNTGIRRQKGQLKLAERIGEQNMLNIVGMSTTNTLIDQIHDPRVVDPTTIYDRTYDPRISTDESGFQVANPGEALPLYYSLLNLMTKYQAEADDTKRARLFTDARTLFPPAQMAAELRRIPVLGAAFPVGVSFSTIVNHPGTGLVAQLANGSILAMDLRVALRQAANARVSEIIQIR